MLQEKELQTLQKLKQHYNLDHLKLDSGVYSIEIPQSQYFQKKAENVRGRRRIYYKVNYEPEENNSIVKIKQEFKRNNITYKFSDETILKHLHTAEFHQEKTIKRLLEVQQYLDHDTTLKFTYQTINMLKSGMIYTFGKSKQYFPIIVIRVDKLDFNQKLEQFFNAIYYLMLVVRHYQMVPYHAERMIMLVDLNFMDVSKVPYKYVYDVLGKLSLYTCGFSQKILVYHAKGISWVWSLVSKFLAEHSKKKIIFVQDQNYTQILDLIDQNQLEIKYGGKLQNQVHFWPPHSSTEVRLHADFQSETDYFSIENDQIFFDENEQKKSSCENCGCQIC